MISFESITDGASVFFFLFFFSSFAADFYTSSVHNLVKKYIAMLPVRNLIQLSSDLYFLHSYSCHGVALLAVIRD